MMVHRWSNNTLPTDRNNPMKIRKLTGQRIVAEARTWIATPYIHQASVKHVGCDCLGLVRGVWRELVGEEPQATPAYSSSWAEAGGRDRFRVAVQQYFDPIDKRSLKPGDLMLFRLRARSPAKHLGLFTGNSRFIHAYDGASVVESAMSDFWYRRIDSTYRFPGVDG